MKTVTGDLFAITQPGQALSHGCNAQGVMGGGIAVEFRRRFPNDYTTYNQVCRKAHAGNLMGSSLLTGASDGVYRFCSFTQVHTGTPDSERRDGRQDRLAWIMLSLIDALHQCEVFEVSALNVPLIGCGLAGLTWNEVGPIMQLAQDSTDDVELVVVEFKPAAAPHRARTWDVIS